MWRKSLVAAATLVALSELAFPFHPDHLAAGPLSDLAMIDAYNRAVTKRLREEFAKLQVEINDAKNRIVDLERGLLHGGNIRPPTGSLATLAPAANIVVAPPSARPPPPGPAVRPPTGSLATLAPAANIVVAPPSARPPPPGPAAAAASGRQAVLPMAATPAAPVAGGTGHWTGARPQAPQPHSSPNTHPLPSPLSPRRLASAPYPAASSSRRSSYPANRLGNPVAFATDPPKPSAAGFPTQTNAVTNGDFATGNFTGWTLFNTPFGLLGATSLLDPTMNDGLPAVTLFSVTGSGEQNAATFNVGNNGGNGSGVGTQQGGGIRQTVTLPGGEIDFSASIASAASTIAGGSSLSGGVFNVLLDGTTEDTVDIGAINQGQVIRNTLSFETTESAGTHTLEILITRPFGNSLNSPHQYITDIDIAEIPLPPAIYLFGSVLGGAFWLGRRKRRAVSGLGSA